MPTCGGVRDDAPTSPPAHLSYVIQTPNISMLDLVHRILYVEVSVEHVMLNVV